MKWLRRDRDDAEDIRTAVTVVRLEEVTKRFEEIAARLDRITEPLTAAQEGRDRGR